MSNPRCRECGGDGFLEVVVGGHIAMKRCACAEKDINRARLRRLNAVVPGIFRGVSLDTNPIASLPKSQQAKVRTYYKRLSDKLESGNGLWLTGETGTGKTAVAALLTRRAAELGFSTRFCEVPELLNRLRWTYKEDAVLDDRELYADLAEADLLVLDDLGAPRVNDWVLEQLFLFINGRYKTGRAVIVTSDVDPHELRRQIGARTVRRLGDICGKPLTLTFAEPDTDGGSPLFETAGLAGA
jgi:DNA replication protein DnaC